MRVKQAFVSTTIAAFALLWSAGGLRAQSPNSTDRKDEKGFVWLETFQGRSDTLGAILKLDSATGYKFGPHFEIDVGVPFYFVHATSSSTASGLSSGNGIGDPHVDLQFTLENDATQFVSSLTGRAPVGDTSKGLSTGRATFDWNNYLELTAGRFSPFVDAGIANSISDTRFFTRPFTSLGTVAHFEGGGYLRLRSALSLGASAYADAPFGEQKVYSKLIQRGHSESTGHGRGMGAKKGAFESESVTIGDASIARDNGGSVWLDVYPGNIVGFQAGFSRSMEYDLNSVFFGIVLNVGNWVRSR